jgi:predicted ribosomally synthesized peptide with nif11-like leader
MQISQLYQFKSLASTNSMSQDKSRKTANTLNLLVIQIYPFRRIIMSIENVNQFYQVVSQDPALQLQFQFATDEEKLVNMAVELGQQHGYSFTSEEVIQAIALAHPATETTGMVELADEQLEAVAGGKGESAPPQEETSSDPFAAPILPGGHGGRNPEQPQKPQWERIVQQIIQLPRIP